MKKAFLSAGLILGIAFGSTSLYSVMQTNDKSSIVGEDIINVINKQENYRLDEMDFYLYKSPYQTVLRGQATYLDFKSNYTLRNGFMGVTTILQVKGKKLSAPLDSTPLKNVNVNSDIGKDRIKKDYMYDADPLKTLKNKQFLKIAKNKYQYKGACLNQKGSCLTEVTTIDFNTKFLPIKITRNIKLSNGANFFTTDITYGNFN